MKCLIGFPVILKWLTQNDLEMPCWAKICFHHLSLEFSALLSKTTVKTNERIPLFSYEIFASNIPFTRSNNHQANIEQLKHTSCTCILNAFVGCLLDDCSMFAWSCKWGISIVWDNTCLKRIFASVVARGEREEATMNSRIVESD